MIQYAPFTSEQAEYIRRSQESWLNVLEGGKRASKNVVNLVAWSACLETHPDTLHLAGGVSAAVAKMNIVDSNGFGLEHIFAGRCRRGNFHGRECLYIRTKTGVKVVIIAGGGKSDDARRIKGNSYGSVYVTEANECHQLFVQECIDRTLASGRRQIFFDLNPKSPAHWFYRDILDFQDALCTDGRNPGYNYAHFTIVDNMSLSDAQIRREMVKYDKHSLWYKADILGHREMPSGLIYSMFSEEKNVYDEELDEKTVLGSMRYVSIDYGTANPCAFLYILYDRENRMVYVDREYYYDGRSEMRQKTDAEYGDDLRLFASPGSIPGGVIIDPSALSFRVALRRMGYKVRDADNDVLNGIRDVAMLMQSGRLKIHRRCKGLIGELGLYLWDSAAAERGVEQPVKQHDHACDALRYFVRTILNMKRFLNGGAA